MAAHTLFLFNPEHDLALASGEEHYMAPASARRMASELALLPVWYASPGSSVLAASAYNLDYLQQLQQQFSLPVALLTVPELSDSSLTDIHPWGWNPSVCRFLHEQGVPAECLLSAELLALHRTFSHRSKAVELLPHLQLNEWFCGESYFFQEAEEWRAFIETHERCLLKAPLSGSGKGLNWCKGVYTPSISGWCSRVATSQGGVIAEPIYNRVADFAMEFVSDGQGQVSWIGYSLFCTGKSGMYEGNWLLSNESIAERLSSYVPVSALTALQHSLVRLLSQRVGNFYKGYLGVDMMICQCGNEAKPMYRIHPCVEINLRMNMGVLARMIYDRYMDSSATGIFRMDYYPVEGEALKQSERLSKAFPLVVCDSKLKSGYLPLVPVHKKSCYLAWVQVASCTASLSFP